MMETMQITKSIPNNMMKAMQATKKQTKKYDENNANNKQCDKNNANNKEANLTI